MTSLKPVLHHRMMNESSKQRFCKASHLFLALAVLRFCLALFFMMLSEMVVSQAYSNTKVPKSSRAIWISWIRIMISGMAGSRNGASFVPLVASKLHQSQLVAASAGLFTIVSIIRIVASIMLVIASGKFPRDRTDAKIGALYFLPSIG